MLWGCFWNSKEKLNSEKSHNPGKLGIRLKCLGAKSRGPTLDIIFRWMGTSAIYIFDTQRMNFLFLCLPVSTESSKVKEFKNNVKRTKTCFLVNLLFIRRINSCKPLASQHHQLLIDRVLDCYCLTRCLIPSIKCILRDWLKLLLVMHNNNNDNLTI